MEKDVETLEPKRKADPKPADEAVGQDQPRVIPFTPDRAALEAANGDPEVWAKEIARMLAFATSTEFDPSTFTPWLESFSGQIVRATRRSVAMSIANEPVQFNGSNDTQAELIFQRNAITERLLWGI